MRAMYFTWRGMKSRCDNPNNPAYKNYGGRSISYDPRWAEFSAFLKDMGSTHRMGLELDRRNNNGNYTRRNCRWTTAVEQHNNKRTNRMVRFRGKLQSLAKWVRELGVSRGTLKWRLSQGRALA